MSRWPVHKWDLLALSVPDDKVATIYQLKDSNNNGWLRDVHDAKLFKPWTSIADGDEFADELMQLEVPPAP